MVDQLSAARVSRVTTARGTPTPRKFRPDIQGLRTIAVVIVALYHAGVPFLRGGYVGVDVFFVISGFLITRQLFGEASLHGRVNLVRFYSQRARRLLPSVALVVSTTVMMAHFFLPYDQLKSLIKDVYYASFYGINYHFAQAGVQYQNATNPPSALQHFWSLAVEEQFYVIWPLLIIICAVIGRRRYRHALTIGVIAALSGGTLAYCIKISGSNRPVAYFSLQTRAWELGFGALVALTATQWARVSPQLARLIGWAGLTAILGTAVLYSDNTVYPGVAALVPVAGAAMLIASGVLRNSRTPETVLLERPFMQYGGKVSYAWYLWHWPMLILLPAWVGHSLNTWEKVEIVGLAFWFAVLTYFLENAAHRASWDYRRWAQVGIGLSGLVALVALIGSATLPNLLGTGNAAQTSALTRADLSVVQTAVTKSINIKAVPSNLTPTLTKAFTDTPAERSKGCFATLLMTDSPQCVYGDERAPAAQTAVIIGDSHSDQWLAALAVIAQQQHWKIIQLTKAACPVAAVTIYEQDLKRTYTECDAFRSWAESRIAAIKPALIIASEADVLADKVVTASVWAAKTLDELKKVAGNTSGVAYLGDTPTTYKDAVTCLGQHLSDAGKCANRRTDVVHLDRFLAVQRSIKAADMGYVDTRPFFCGLEWCPAIVNNMLVHRDQGHITNTYALWLKPMLKPIFVGAHK